MWEPEAQRQAADGKIEVINMQMTKKALEIDTSLRRQRTCENDKESSHLSEEEEAPKGPEES